MRNTVLFDLEDTLISTPWADLRHVIEFRRATRSKLIELGIPAKALEGIERATLMRNKAADYIETTFTPTGKAQFKEEINVFLARYEMDSARKSTLFQDTVATLELLRKRKAKMGLVTNTSRKAVDWVFRSKNLGRFFDCVVTRENVKKLKPDPEGIMLALKTLDARSFFMVGDLIIDVLAAKNAGGAAILLKRDKEANIKNKMKSLPAEVLHKIEEIREERLKLQADYVVKSLQEVPDIIQKHEGIKR